MHHTDFIEYINSAYSGVVAHFPCAPCIAGHEETLRVYGRVWVTQCSSTHGVCDILVDEDLKPFEISIRDRNGRSYRWVHPDFREARKNIIGDQYHTRYPDEFTMDRDLKETWHETESLEDVVDKVGKILNGLPHDHKVVIYIDLPKDLHDALLAIAAKENKEFTTLFEEIITAELERICDKAP